MSDHQDAIAAAMNRRIQDSALRAARLNAQYAEERQHTTDLQAELSAYQSRQAQLHAVAILDNAEDG